MSKIIAFEGADRCGKATQSKLLKEYIESIGKKAIVIEAPINDGPFYRMIYWMLKNGLAKTFPRIFQMFNFFNKWIFQTMKLTKIEHCYDFIIFDRWSLSSVIYGAAEGLEEKYCLNLYKLLRKPDFTIMLLGQPYKHESEDVYESDAILQDKVRKLYAEWSNDNPKDSHVIDGTGMDKEILFDEIRRILRTCRITPI